MTSSDNFLQLANKCPVCQNLLSLYLVISSIGTFKCNNNFVKNKKNRFSFYPLKDNIFELSNSVLPSDFINITAQKNNNFNLNINSESLFKELIDKYLSFFYLCDLSAINDCSNSKDINNYEIDACNCCYVKFTNLLSFSKDKQITLSLNSNTPTLEEIFNINHNDDSYILVNDFNRNKTIFYYQNNKSIDSSFNSEFNLLSNTLDFSDKNKIINKFKSWILMS
jgi:hypothetical protein